MLDPGNLESVRTPASSEVRETLGAEVREGEICFWAAAIDDKQCGACLTMGFFFNLGSGPDSPIVAQVERGEFFYSSAGFERLFHVYRKVDGVIEPGANLCVMSLIGRAGSALQQ